MNLKNNYNFVKKTDMNNLSLTLDLSRQKRLRFFLKPYKKGSKGIELTISTSTKITTANQNVSAWVATDKGRKGSREEKFYVWQWACFWGDGVIPKMK